MTKAKYMALADLQDLWTNKLKAWINSQKADRKDVDTVASRIGTESVYEYVDLGLPSGTLWAKCNVGAETETGYGNYYMYGKGSTQYNYGDSEYEGMENPLASSADTATQVMGAPWHQPTMAQIQELIDNTTYTWETNFNGSGINGGKFTAANGNYIFIPAAGGYAVGTLKGVGENSSIWSSTSYWDDQAKRLFFNNDTHIASGAYRSVGYPIRGVVDSSFDLLINVKEELDGKADKVSGSGLNNHVAALNSNGNLKDSGVAVSDLATQADLAEVDRRYRITVSGNKVTFSESPVLVSGHKVTFN